MPSSSVYRSRRGTRGGVIWSFMVSCPLLGRGLGRRWLARRRSLRTRHC